ncbi:MAG: DUF3106 domain-containing protein [Chthoniobacter sp.]|nr:DUF3106 domain-containing protein [Chthoniobacter sp.]
MARQLTLLQTLGLLAFTTVSQAVAQPPSSSPPPKRQWFGGGDRDHRRPSGTPSNSGTAEDFEKFNNVRKAIEALTPEQRQRFQENFLRWSNLSPEEKKALADRMTFRRNKIVEDIDAAIKETGLELDSTQRERFAKRYGEERHLIEEQLRKDMDEKRRPLLREVIAKLKTEFTSGGSATGPAEKPVEVPAPVPNP